MDTLETLMHGRTTLIISHRLSTVHHLDKIAVVQGGTVAEVGTGADLLAADGTYAQLYKAGNYGSLAHAGR